jgi:phage shock protein PspC (stress-responsive transcriptional regulator)
MKKSFSVNISGIIFQIDEDAYDKLNRYLDRLNLHFASTEGKEEIIADIEQRIAEMLVAKLGDQHRIVTLTQIEEVIRLLGEPADFDDNIHEPVSSERRYRRRLYRDSDDKVLGGVAGGMGAYFNTDPLWFRIAFIVLTLFGGSGVLVYLILWLIVPEARTTAEKLEMRGEEININNIEKSIRDEMHEIRNRFGKWKQESTRKKKDSAGRVIESAADMFVTLFALFFKFLAGIIGFAILVGGIVLIVSIFIPGLSFHGFPILFDVSVHDFLTALTGSPGTGWLLLGGLSLILIIPLLGLIWTGIRLLFGMRVHNRGIGIGFTGLWVMAFLFVCIVGIITVNDFSTKGFVSKSEQVSSDPADTLYIAMIPGQASILIDEDDHDWFFRTTLVEQEDDGLVLVGRPKIEFRQSPGDSVTVTVTGRARGRNAKQAHHNARQINYEMNTSSNQLSIGQFFASSKPSLFRNQEVKVNVYIPENKVFKLEPAMQNNFRQITNFDPLWDEQLPGQYLVMKNNKVVAAQ